MAVSRVWVFPAAAGVLSSADLASLLVGYPIRVNMTALTISPEDKFDMEAYLAGDKPWWFYVSSKTRVYSHGEYIPAYRKYFTAGVKIKSLEVDPS